MTEEVQTQANTNFASVNDLAKMLNGNYRTVGKIIARMLANNEVIEQEVTKHHRAVKVYSYDNNTIKKLQAELKAIRSPKNAVAYNKNAVAYNNITNTGRTSTTDQLQQEQANVTIYEVTKKNNELENAINEYKIQVAGLEADKVKLQSDIYKLEADKLLIEDKKSAFESEVGRLTQDNKELTNTIQTKDKEIENLKTSKNRIITILSAVLLVIVTVAVTVLAIKGIR